MLVFCLLVFYSFKRVQVAGCQLVAILGLVFRGKIVKPFFERAHACVYVAFGKNGAKN